MHGLRKKGTVLRTYVYTQASGKTGISIYNTNTCPKQIASPGRKAHWVYTLDFSDINLSIKLSSLVFCLWIHHYFTSLR